MGNKLEAVKTVVTPPQMLEALGRGWMRLFNSAPSREACAVLIAQWAFETGWGKSMICFNPGNIRCPDVNGRWDYCTYNTWEIVNGARVAGPGTFRAFASLEDGCADYLGFLHDRYRGNDGCSAVWDAVTAGDPDKFVHLIKAHGYFTGDETTYDKAVASIFRSINKLPESDWEQQLRFGAPTVKDLSAVAPANDGTDNGDAA